LDRLHSTSNDRAPNTVLLVVFIAAHFSELIRAARLLRDSGRFTPVVWFAWPYREIDRDAAVCAAENVRHLRDRAGSAVGAEAALSAQPAASKAVGARVWGGARAVLTALPFPFTAVRSVGRQRQQLSFARAIVDRIRPLAVILAEDTVGYETAAVIKAAHERGAPSLIIPFTVANALEPAEMFFNDRARSMSRWTNRLIARAFPRWVYEHRGRRLLRVPGEEIIAKEWWGLAPPLPWQMNSGGADAIAVESRVMDAYYRREGLPPPRLVLTGGISDDTLAENLHDVSTRRAALCAELGLPADRKILLCAMPDDRFALPGAPADFTGYPDLVHFVTRTLKALPGFAVVVRLHPRSTQETARLVEETGVRTSLRDTAALVPLCDLYVASVSATIRWAIACGKPAVNYDVYRLRLTDYDDVSGVLRVEDRSDFVAVTERLAADRRFFERVRAEQEAAAPEWGNLDGHAGARILTCLDTLIEEARKEMPA
jgi:hypothetical protein